jgi:hypothetical protein
MKFNLQPPPGIGDFFLYCQVAARLNRAGLNTNIIRHSNIEQMPWYPLLKLTHGLTFEPYTEGNLIYVDIPENERIFPDFSTLPKVHLTDWLKIPIIKSDCVIVQLITSDKTSGHHKGTPDPGWVADIYDGREIIAIGSTSDKLLVEKLLEGRSFTNLCGETSLLEAVGLIAGCYAVISNESFSGITSGCCHLPTVQLWRRHLVLQASFMHYMAIGSLKTVNICVDTIPDGIDVNIFLNRASIIA